MGAWWYEGAGGRLFFTQRPRKRDQRPRASSSSLGGELHTILRRLRAELKALADKKGAASASASRFSRAASSFSSGGGGVDLKRSFQKYDSRRRGVVKVDDFGKVLLRKVGLGRHTKY